MLLYAQMLIVVNFFPDFFRNFEIFVSHFLGLVPGIMVPDRSRKIREKISCKMVPISPHITFRGPRYEGTTVLKKMILTTIKATTINMYASFRSVFKIPVFVCKNATT